MSLCSRVSHIFKCRLLSLSVFDAYEKIAELTIEDSIKNELSGDFERLMLAVGERWCRPLDHTQQLPALYSTNCSFSLFFCLLSHTVQCIRSIPMFFARRLYKSMKVNAGHSDSTEYESHSVCFIQRHKRNIFCHSLTVFNSRKITIHAHRCTSVLWSFPSINSRDSEPLTTPSSGS